MVGLVSLGTSEICYTFVNHFRFCIYSQSFRARQGRKVFKQSAPVIKLHGSASEADYLALLGVLNSSTACFCLKQVSHNMGSTVDAQGARTTLDAWENFYQFNGSNVSDIPLPKVLPLERPRDLLACAQKLAMCAPSAVVRESVPPASDSRKLSPRLMCCVKGLSVYRKSWTGKFIGSTDCWKKI